MKIYTKTGDDGTTGLYGGSRLLKSHIRIEAYGTIDELNATLGLVHASEKDGEMKSILETIQSKLFNIGSVLASNPDKEKDLPSVDETDIQLLEVTIDEIEKGLTPLKNFILPSGNKEISYCHLARTVCRRAERRLISLHEIHPVSPLILQYLNRLSDFLFIMARKMAKDYNLSEIPWKSGK